MTADDKTYVLLVRPGVQLGHMQCLLKDTPRFFELYGQKVLDQLRALFVPSDDEQTFEWTHAVRAELLAMRGAASPMRNVVAALRALGRRRWPLAAVSAAFAAASDSKTLFAFWTPAFAAYMHIDLAQAALSPAQFAWLEGGARFSRDELVARGVGEWTLDDAPGELVAAVAHMHVGRRVLGGAMAEDALRFLAEREIELNTLGPLRHWSDKDRAMFEAMAQLVHAVRNVAQKPNYEPRSERSKLVEAASHISSTRETIERALEAYYRVATEAVPADKK